MIAKKTTTTLSGSVATIQPDVAIRNFVAFAKVWRGATINMVCAATNFLLVSCYLVADEKSRLSVTDAMDEMRKVIKNAAGIKGDMLGIYTTRAKSLYQVLTEGNKYPVIVQELAKFANTAEGAEKATAHLAAYIEVNWNIASLRQLSAFLGYRLPVNRQSGQSDGATTPSQKVANVITNAIKTATKAASEAHVPASVAAKAIANQVSDPLLLAREACKRYAATDKADPSDLLDFIKVLEALVDDVTKRAESKVKADKEAAKMEGAPAMARKRGPKHGKETTTNQA